tara:strand:- start:334 stop:507 length:174 start_codon:yes stop_codon:yes gene_type:complete
MKIKGVDLKGLTKRQVSAMRRHSRHHTAKHLKAMTLSMKKGKTFTQSHIIAQRKIGR